MNMFVIDRTTGLGGSDANRIWHNQNLVQLWKVKTKRDMEEDLSNVFRVQLGVHTESFHIEWLAKTEFAGKIVTRPTPGQEVKQFTFRDVPLFAHLDAKVDNVILECKHSNARATVEHKARYYAPQLHHYMKVYNQDWCYLSVILGNDDPKVVRVDWNQEFYDRLFAKMKRFWLFVKNDKQPPYDSSKTYSDDQLEQEVLIDGMKDYLEYDNELYRSLDGMMNQYQGAVTSFEETKKKMKLLVPKDARRCEFPNSNYVITRNKKGTLVVKTKGE